MYGLVRLARPIVLDSARIVERDVRTLGWTVATRAVVEILHAAGPSTVPQIGQELSLARQNVQRVVDTLIDAGDAQAVANPAHRRSMLIRLTRRGTASYETLHRREVQALSAMASDFTDAEIALAERVFASLAADIHERSRHGEAQAHDRA